MINIKSVLTEDRNSTIDAGCLMAMFPDEYCKILNKYNEKLIPDKVLYIKDGEFGREKECHVTIKYGFKPDLTEIEIRRILKEQKPFMIRLKSISQFNNEEFDVIKFDVESPTLVRLNNMASKYPNDDKYPNYHPHSTIAYVKKGTFPYEKDGIKLYIPIKTICYSPILGEKSYFNL